MTCDPSCGGYRRGYAHGYLKGLIIAHDDLLELSKKAASESREGFFWLRMGRTHLWDLMDRVTRDMKLVSKPDIGSL